MSHILRGRPLRSSAYYRVRLAVLWYCAVVVAGFFYFIDSRDPIGASLITIFAALSSCAILSVK